jgi:hypothetical protein
MINDKLMNAIGAQLSMNVRNMTSIKSLHDAEFSIYSQNGEDGIIEFLVHNLDIEEEIFIEFGVESYIEANTRFLLLNRNWRGLVIDGDLHNIQKVKQWNMFWKYDLLAVQNFITAEKINTIFVKNGFEGNIGLLSIDIDGNDYYVWDAIHVVNPAIVVCEYNAVFGDIFPVSIPYAKDFVRHNAHYSGLYFGCSLPALLHLAEKKGYTFVGTERIGANAFFVRNDVYPKIASKIFNITSDPIKSRQSRDRNGKLSYLRGKERLRMIRDLPIVNVVSGDILRLHEIENSIYSAGWNDA